MRAFRTVREAKDYLAGKIVEEAQRQGVLLTEVERKMLYFSETDWTLTDMMAVSAEFDRDYNQDEYEARIAGLVAGIKAREETQREQEREDWYQAVLKLCEGDHYLLVLIDAGAPKPLFSGRLGRWMPAWDDRAKREPGDRMRLVLVTLGLTIVLLTITLIIARFR